MPLWLLCLSLGIPIREIDLETQGVQFKRLAYDKLIQAIDGTYLLADSDQLWHWDREGRLLRKIGGKSGGPGRIEGLGIFYWDGRYYWLVDSWQLASLIYDEEGRFLTKDDRWFRQFLSVGDQLFVQDFSKYKEQNRLFPPVVKEVDFQVMDGRLQIKDGSVAFKKVSPRQMEFGLDLKLIWMVREGETFLVMDQLNSKIWIYDQSARTMEVATDPDKPSFPKFIPVSLSRYIPPPDFSFYPKTREEYREWFFTWSRITHFTEAGDDGYLVAYEVPDPDNPKFSMQAVEKVDKRGHSTGEALVVRGFFMGLYKNKVSLLTEQKQEDGVRYQIQVHDF